MTAPLLRLEGVGKTFRHGGDVLHAVAGVTLDLLAGEIVGLAGPNGAGKTTLLRLAAGALVPDHGAISVAGHAPRSTPARRILGFAPDGPVFPPTLTVREVLDYYARLHVSGAAHLSTGFVQRLALAQAALGGRRVLLLDETLSGIDPVVRRALCDRLQWLAHSGVAVLLSSHDLAALERLASRVLVLRRGVVVREAPLASLLRERVLEIVLDAPPATPPPGVRATAAGLEIDLGSGTVEGALALCRSHRLAVRATRVRLKSLEDVVLDTLDDPAR